MNAVNAIKNAVTKDTIRMMLVNAGLTLHELSDDGTSYRCRCPLHNGDNPSSFVWNYTNGLWYCFTGCDRGGDVLDFVSILLDLPIEHEFRLVVNKTAEMLGVNISNLELGERRDMWMRDQHAWMTYMQKKAHKNTNKQYDLHQLGENFVVNSYRNFTEETLRHFDVLYNRQYNRLIVPIYDEAGICIGAAMRRINDADEHKWLNRPKHIDTGRVLFNYNNIEDKSELTLVEGAFDVFNLYQLGVKNASGCFGAHLTDEQILLICKETLSVTLAYDTDDAGRKATKKAIEKLKCVVNVYVYDFEEHDPGEIQEYNPELIIPWWEWMQKYYPEPEA